MSFILHTNQFLLLSLPLSYLPPHHPLFLHLHSERDSPLLDMHKAWHIKLRQDQTPPPAPRLGEIIQHGEQVTKIQLSARERSCSRD